MAVQVIDIGAEADDGTGDTLRGAFAKCNGNWAEFLERAGGTLTGAVRETVLAHGNSGTSETFALGDGNLHTVTWTGNCTVTLTPGTGAGRMTILAAMDGTERAITWPTVTWLTFDGGPPDLRGAGETDLIVLIWDGADWYGMHS